MGIWTLEAPGGRPRQLTPDFATNHSAPRDGSFVVYNALHEDRFRIWRMDADGANARLLTQGVDDMRPFVSPDGQWIYYTAGGPGAAVMRARADGSGAPAVVTGRPLELLGLSPDGRSLLVSVVEPSEGASHAVLDAESGASTARVNLPAEARPGWGRDSSIVAYLLDTDGVTNLWEQPIAGGPPRQITQFTSGQMFHFAYSTDGTRLFLSRGRRTGDLWALRNFR